MLWHIDFKNSHGVTQITTKDCCVLILCLPTLLICFSFSADKDKEISTVCGINANYWYNEMIEKVTVSMTACYRIPLPAIKPTAFVSGSSVKDIMLSFHRLAITAIWAFICLQVSIILNNVCHLPSHVHLSIFVISSEYLNPICQGSLPQPMFWMLSFDERIASELSHFLILQTQPSALDWCCCGRTPDAGCFVKKRGLIS